MTRLNSALTFIEKIACLFGRHKMRVGFGWSRGKRFDCCYTCNFSVWVKDDEGYKKIMND